jgi:hypothetical protein
MFYDENSISKILACPLCENKLDDPCLLLCGKFVCEKCIQTPSSSDEGQEYVCKLCKNKHNTNSFSKIELATSLSIIKPVEIYRGKTYEDFKHKLNQLKNDTQHLDEHFLHGCDFIKEHCDRLRNDIQLVTESKIEELSTNRETLLNQVNFYEKICLEHSKKRKIFFTNSRNDVGKLIEFGEKWKNYLAQSNIEHDKLKTGLNSLERNLSYLKSLQAKTNEILYSQKMLEFKPNEQKTTCQILGTFNSVISERPIQSCDFTSVLIKEIDLECESYQPYSMDFFPDFGFVMLYVKEANSYGIMAYFDNQYALKSEMRIYIRESFPKILCLNSERLVLVRPNSEEVEIYLYDKSLNFIKTIKLSNQQLKSVSAHNGLLFVMTDKNFKIYDENFCLKDKLSSKISQYEQVKSVKNVELMVQEDLILILFYDSIDHSKMHIIQRSDCKLTKTLDLTNFDFDTKWFGVLDDQRVLFLSKNKNYLVIYDYKFVTTSKLEIFPDFYRNISRVIQNKHYKTQFCALDSINQKISLFQIYEDETEEPTDLSDYELIYESD